MNARRSSLFIAAAALAAALPARAQTPTSTQVAPVAPTPGVAAERFTFRGYIGQVGQGNLELAAQRATLTVAQAQIAIARVFPDPQVTAGLLQYDVTQKGNPTATIVQLNVPVEMGGKRGSRIEFAQASLSAAEADLEEFLRGLRATAADSYIDAIHARLILERKRQTLSSLERLVTVNEQRLKAGDIGEVTLLQSRVEAQQFRAEVLDAEGGVRTADLSLAVLLGSRASAVMGRSVEVSGDLRTASARTLDTGALVNRALVERPDLIAARRRLVASSRQIDLAKANRVIDLGLGGLWQHNFSVQGQTPLPASDFLGATVTVPIPFSRMYRGELDTAYGVRRQAEATAQGVAVRVEVEVRQAITKYEAAAARVRLYTGGMLAAADQVLEKTLYNYQRGGATLVEVLVAQRTDNDVYLAYYDALADAAHALVAVQQAVGTWDVDF